MHGPFAGHALDNGEGAIGQAKSGRSEIGIIDVALRQIAQIGGGQAIIGNQGGKGCAGRQAGLKGCNLLLVQHDLLDGPAFRLAEAGLAPLILGRNLGIVKGLAGGQIGGGQPQHLHLAGLHRAEFRLVLGQIGHEFGLGRLGRRFDIGLAQHEIVDGALVGDIAVDQACGGGGEQTQHQLLAPRRIALILEIFRFRQPALPQHLGKGRRLESAQSALEGRIGPQPLAQFLVRHAQAETVRHLVERRILGQILQHHGWNAQIDGLFCRGQRAQLLGDLVDLPLIGAQEGPRADFGVAHAGNRARAQIGDDIVDAESGYTHQQERPKDLAGPGFRENTQTIEHFRRSVQRLALYRNRGWALVIHIDSRG